jgi:membrane fusion protein, multidrug efflux system
MPRTSQTHLQRDQTLVDRGGFATQQTVDNESAQVLMLKAAIEGDQAAIEAAQLNLDFATITAPFSGVVSLRNIDIGNLITPAAVVGTVTQIEPIAVDFTLPQSDLAVLQSAAKKGTPAVLVYGQSGNDLLAKGQLEVINNQVDQASGTIKLKARFENMDHKLWPGAFVQAAVVIRTERNALAVPSEAVQRGPDSAYVWLVSSDETVHRHAVQMGEIQDGVTVISSGVKAGDRLVVAGQYSLIEGARITEINPAQIAQTQG